MKFDIERLSKTSSWYSEWPEDLLAWKDALPMAMTRENRVTESFFRSFKRNPFGLDIKVGRDGKLKAEIHSNRNSKQGEKDREKINEILEGLIEFIEVCYDHGLLKRDEDVKVLDPLICPTCKHVGQMDRFCGKCYCKYWRFDVLTKQKCDYYQPKEEAAT